MTRTEFENKLKEIQNKYTDCYYIYMCSLDDYNDSLGYNINDWVDSLDDHFKFIFDEQLNGVIMITKNKDYNGREKIITIPTSCNFTDFNYQIYDK